jgi:hypothetical protein
MALSNIALWAKMPKANSELFALTYGALVTELIRDYDNPKQINEQLDRIGHSIGVRCVDEFLSKADTLAGGFTPACNNLRETAEVIAKIGFKMFLGVSCDVTSVAPDNSAFSLLLYDNPLTIFVELPAADESTNGCDLSKVQYSNLYCGVIRGALEQVNLRVECKFVKDVLQGDDMNEIRVELKEVLMDGAGDDYKEE